MQIIFNQKATDLGITIWETHFELRKSIKEEEYLNRRGLNTRLGGDDGGSGCVHSLNAVSHLRLRFTHNHIKIYSTHTPLLLYLDLERKIKLEREKKRKKGKSKAKCLCIMNDMRFGSRSLISPERVPLFLSRRYLVQLSFNFPHALATSSVYTVPSHALSFFPFLFLCKNDLSFFHHCAQSR